MIQLEIQNASDSTDLPREEHFTAWAKAALGERDAELVIRIVDEMESAELNQCYRHKQGPTNVLSFPFEAPPGVEMELLGDVVLCAPVVLNEANEQGKSVESHWAHLVVHGVLHLLGYDHLDDEQAAEMEAKEIAILRGMGIRNPYEVVEE